MRSKRLTHRSVEGLIRHLIIIMGAMAFRIGMNRVAMCELMPLSDLEYSAMLVEQSSFTT